jgi:hypothetical protein
MSVGKYSPTVSASYAADKNWWTKNGGGITKTVSGIVSGAAGVFVDTDLDNDGYDRYGYNVDGVDRAGFDEDSYLGTYDIDEIDGEECITYDRYDMVAAEWNGKKIGPAFQ